MRLAGKRYLFILILVMILINGCTVSKQPVHQKSPFIPGEQGSSTMAILPFENNSVTDAEKYEPLSQGLAAMLITDLKKYGSSLKLIERLQIQALLKEIALARQALLSSQRQ